METRFQRCPQCGKTYDGPNLLDYHQREAHGPGTPESDPRPGRIFCSTCGLPFDGEGPLSHHKREAHGEILVTSSPSGRGGTVGRVGAAYLAGRGSRLVAAIVDGLIGIIPLYGLIDILFIFRGDKRCIHDLIAGTKVVA